MNRVYLRAQTLLCAHGADLPAIIASVRGGNQPTVAREIAAAKDPVTRRMYALQGFQEELPTRRLAAVLSATLKQVIEQSGLSKQELQHMPILIGSVYLDIPAEEYGFDQPYLREMYQMNSIENTCKSFGLHGEVTTFSTACTSSINALNAGVAHIQAGAAPRVLVLGLETYNPLAFWGFEGFGILSPTDSFRPFDKARNGFMVGEACGAVILDTASGKQDDFYYLGSASLCDTHNIAGNDPTGLIMGKTMAQALQDARISSADITAIKAHAAGSDGSDRTELMAIQRLFGLKVPPFTAVKPYIGHTLAASGLAELIIMTGSIQQGFLPKTLNYETPDDGTTLEPIKTDLPLRTGTILLNYFGFGGGCTCTVISNEQVVKKN